MFFITIPHTSDSIPEALKNRINPDANLDEMAEPAIDRIFSWMDIDTLALDIHQCIINCNRARNDVNPRTNEPYSPMTSLFPKCDFHGTSIFLSAKTPTDQEYEDLLRAYYDPFYKKIETLIASGKYAFFLDVHAMNSTITSYQDSDRHEPTNRPDICISNNGDESGGVHADGSVLAFPQSILVQITKRIQEKGYECRMNAPFRGGYILQTFATKFPCLQIEINKRLYMTADDGDVLPEKVQQLHDDLQEVFIGLRLS